MLINKDREGLIRGKIPSDQLWPADSQGQMLQANASNVQAARRHREQLAQRAISHSSGSLEEVEIFHRCKEQVAALRKPQSLFL